jgi:hypothetical protein
MTRKELCRLTRALMPYMASAEASDAHRILIGLEMKGTRADVDYITSMVADHLKGSAQPDGLRAALALAEASDENERQAR